MTKESAYTKVATAAHKITGLDVTELPSGRSSKHMALVRGIVYHILMKYYGLTRQETAQLAGTDHGSVSYHIIRHKKRYDKTPYYHSMYEKIISYMYGTEQNEKYKMIDELINQI